MDFPPRLWSDKTEPIPTERSINTCSNFKHLPLVKRAVGDDVWNHVRKSQLGVLCKFQEIGFRTNLKLLHFLLCKQLFCKKPYEMWFLIAGQPKRFSLLDFEDITGLNCGETEETPVVEDEAALREERRFFSLFELTKGRDFPCIEDIEWVCRNGLLPWSREDKIRLSYLAILTNGLLALDRRQAIFPAEAKVVMDLDRCDRHPWGRVAFRDLMREFKLVTNVRIRQNSFVCKGFLQVLLVWAFVHIPLMRTHLGSPTGVQHPPILGFKGRNAPPDLSNFLKRYKLTVVSMTERSLSEVGPVWTDDQDDEQIENLVTHLREGKSVTEIAWRVEPVWPLPQNERRKRIQKPRRMRKKSLKRSTDITVAGDESDNAEAVYDDSHASELEEEQQFVIRPRKKIRRNMGYENNMELSYGVLDRLGNVEGVVEKLLPLVPIAEQLSKLVDPEEKSGEKPVTATRCSHNNPECKSLSRETYDTVHGGFAGALPTSARPYDGSKCAEYFPPSVASTPPNEGHSDGLANAYGAPPQGNELEPEEKEDVKTKALVTDPVVNDRTFPPERNSDGGECLEEEPVVKNTEDGIDAVKVENNDASSERKSAGPEGLQVHPRVEEQKLKLPKREPPSESTQVEVRKPNTSVSVASKPPNEGHSDWLANAYGPLQQGNELEPEEKEEVKTKALVTDPVVTDSTFTPERKSDGGECVEEEPVEKNREDGIDVVKVENNDASSERKSDGAEGLQVRPGVQEQKLKIPKVEPPSESTQVEVVACKSNRSASVASIKATPSMEFKAINRKRRRLQLQMKNRPRRSARICGLPASLNSPFIPGTEVKQAVKRRTDRDKCGVVDVQTAERRRAVVYGSPDPSSIDALNDFVAKEDSNYPIGSNKKAAIFFSKLLMPRAWLADEHIDAVLDLYRLRLKKYPDMFNDTRIAIMDTSFLKLWTVGFPHWVKLGSHPGGTFEYVHGQAPSYARTDKRWCYDVDTLYCILHVGGNHWVSMVISIPYRSVKIYDAMPKLYTDAQIKKSAKPFARMCPHIIHDFSEEDDKELMDTTEYSIERVRTGVPLSNPPYGDCGVYALKFIECLMLGVKMESTELNDMNMSNVRGKLGAELYAETLNGGANMWNPDLLKDAIDAANDA